jgi:nicotinate dehydrogenase subunit B
MPVSFELPPITTPAITRRGFVKIGGALMVSLALHSTTSAQEGNPANATAAAPPTPLAAWLEIHHDNSIQVRTGRTEIGTGMSAYYAQVIAEELNISPNSITLIMGDTDKTPDGGYSAGFLSGADNLRKVAAYTYQALLPLAAKKLGVPVSCLSVDNGIFSSGNKSITYGALVQGSQLDLKIPVSGTLARIDPKSWNGVSGLDGLVVLGNPPMKAISQYKIVGTSHPMPGTPAKVTGTMQWSCDITLPNMLHARMVRPATLGSSLVAVGTLDKSKFPTSQLVVKNNLVAVLSPNEWEAVSASDAVASTTKWTDWSGLPGSDNLSKTLRAYPFTKPDSISGSAADTAAALAAATRTITASFEQPYMKHAPIAPFVAVADVHPDSAVIYTHSANSQGLRAQIANLLTLPLDKVVVRWFEHAGQFGRTTFGGDGAEGDAAILSQITGRPVRVQWPLEDDLAWSTSSPGWTGDITCALSPDARITAIHSSFYSVQTADTRIVGAVLAQMPRSNSMAGYFIATTWPYDKIPHRLEEVYGAPTLGAPTGVEPANSPIVALRGNIMRTPGQRQQNFILESLLNEAAAATNADPIEFRLQHTTDQRLIDIIHATSKAANWQPHPSPQPNARRTGSTEVTGRGVAIMLRENAYWMGIAEVSVIPDTGAIQVTRFTLGVECGKIINPRQLERCMTSGIVMGTSEALKEEVTFDTGKITSTSWSTYQILTMAEMPDVTIVQLSRDDKGYGGGSEGANGVCPPAIAAAVHDATGVFPRKIPLTPSYISTLLKS